MSATELHAVVKVANAIAETVAEVGPIREGSLYVTLMSLIPGLTLESYTQLVDLLVKAGRLERGPNHLLTAVPR